MAREDFTECPVCGSPMEGWWHTDVTVPFQTALAEWYAARVDCTTEQTPDVRKNEDFRVKLDRLADAESRLVELAKPVSPSSQQPDPEALDPLQHSRP